MGGLDLGVGMKTHCSAERPFQTKTRNSKTAKVKNPKHDFRTFTTEDSIVEPQEQEDFNTLELVHVSDNVLVL